MWYVANRFVAEVPMESSVAETVIFHLTFWYVQHLSLALSES
jgi:hypothetical protein